MNCQYHSNAEAQAICLKCKQPICPECAIIVEDKTVCRHCIQENLFNEPHPLPEKSFWGSFFFFCFSLIPGAAHMHLGLFRRGLHLMLIIFGAIFLAGFIHTDSLIPLAIIPTWFFSFFESHNFRKQMAKGQTIADQGIFNLHLFDHTLILKKNRLLGGIIIVLGLIGFSQVIEAHLVYSLPRIIRNFYFLIRDSIVPLGFILGGIYLISKAKPSPAEPPASVARDIPETHEPE